MIRISEWEGLTGEGSKAFCKVTPAAILMIG